MFSNYTLLVILSLIVLVSSKCSNLYGKNHLDGTCQLVSDCKGAAFIGNCFDKKICCVPEQNLVSSTNSLIDKELFLKMVGNTPRNDWLYDYFSDSMNMAEINTKYKAAMYLSQLIGETNKFRNLESIYPEYDKDLLIGNDEFDDGSIYRGRGAIYLRGKSNYKLASNITNINLFEKPEYAVFPSYAFKIAAWIAKRINLTKLSDGTFFSYTMLTNTLTQSWLDLKDRVIYHERILKELNSPKLKRGNGVECSFKHGTKNLTGVAVPMCLSNITESCGCMRQLDSSQSCPYGLNDKKQCLNSAIIRCCSEKCDTAIDLAILVDTSFKEPHLESIKIFLEDFLLRFSISINETRISFVSVGSAADVLINLSDGTNLHNLDHAIAKLNTNIEKETFVYKAFQSVYIDVFNERQGMRPIGDNIPRVVLLFSNGFDSLPEKTEEEAVNLKHLGINLITVEIGDQLNKFESFSKTQFNLIDMSDLIEKMSTITLMSCYQPALISILENSEVNLKQNEYKFYKYIFSSEYEIEISIEIKELNGQVDFFYSFDNSNPLDPSDNFFPKCVSKSKDDIKYYQISRSEYDKDILYFSFKGKFDTDNRFKIIFHSKIPRSAGLRSANSFAFRISYNLNLLTLCLLSFYSFYKN